MTESTRQDQPPTPADPTEHDEPNHRALPINASQVRVGSSVEVGTTGSESILEALYRHGYSYRIGCRRGGCGICKADLVAGSVSYPVTVADEVLSDVERRTGTCLTCRAVPDGNIEIALRDQELKRGYLAAWLSPQSAPTAPTSTATTPFAATATDTKIESTKHRRTT